MREIYQARSQLLSRQQPIVKSVMGLRSTMLYWLLAVAIIWSIAGLVHLWVRHESMRLGYAISVEDNLRQKLEAKNTELLIKLTTLKSRERLEPIARNSLGMDMPKPGQFIELGVALTQAQGQPVKVASP
jgi:cell division protein FtsL